MYDRKIYEILSSVSHKSIFTDSFFTYWENPRKLMTMHMDIANLPGNSNPLSRVSFDFRPCYPVLRKYDHRDVARALILLVIFKCRLTRGRYTSVLLIFLYRRSLRIRGSRGCSSVSDYSLHKKVCANYTGN